MDDIISISLSHLVCFRYNDVHFCENITESVTYVAYTYNRYIFIIIDVFFSIHVFIYLVIKLSTIILRNIIVGYLCYGHRRRRCASWVHREVECNGTRVLWVLFTLCISYLLRSCDVSFDIQLLLFASDHLATSANLNTRK